jgi:predicted phosphodiesterase
LILTRAEGCRQGLLENVSSPVVESDLGSEIIIDLLRSAWIVEAGRAALYERWAEGAGRFESSASRARARAQIVATALESGGRAPDVDLVEPHTAWVRSLVGDDSEETPLADLFVARLGDWVDAHAGPFLQADAGELTRISAEEHATLAFPETLPPPPPFQPVDIPQLQPPGPVEFRFGILSDLHIGSPAGERMARAAIADLNASGAELVIQLGDITDHGNKDEFELAGKVLAELNMPFATMMGNHDVYSIEEERLAGREYYPPVFGREPDGVLLEHNGFRFAVLDSVEHGASPFAPFDLVLGSFVEGPGGAVVRGAFTSPQHDILAEVAAPNGGPTFVFLHHPPQPFTSFPPVVFGLRDTDSGRLHATADSGNVWGVFCGHTHRNARGRTYGTVPVQEVGIPRDYPFGYALVDVTRTGYGYRFVQLSDEDLLRRGYETAGRIHRRYGTGPDVARAFVWNATD